jgi:hypothetical protein
MKHAIHHIHCVASVNAQPKPRLCGAVPTDAVKCAGGLTA